MAHFAQLDENNMVTQVIVIHNDETVDFMGNESETKGINFCKTIYGENTNWVQTSYNANFRKNYAGFGYTYDQERNAFIPPKFYLSWILDEETCRWIAPIPMPDDGQIYVWNEETQQWIKSDLE